MSKWTLYEATEDHGIYIIDEETGDTICDFYWLSTSPAAVLKYHRAANDEANAPLFLVAREMLAELKKARGLLVQQTRSKDIHDGRFTEIDAAIAKAGGKSR